MKTKSFLFISIFIFSLLSLDAFAANIYIDKGLSGNCTSGNYSIANHTCSGSDGGAYTTIQAGVNAMSVGDAIFIRGGVYLEAVDLPTSKNGRAWTPGNFNTIASFPGEWAVIDGNNSLVDQPVLGHWNGGGDTTPYSDIKYWLIERLEIRNGRFANGSGARGFMGNGGPFRIRYCYIHDNTCSTGANNPYGMGGQHWRNSIVEYNYFKDNGVTPVSTDTNPAHIAIYTDYNWTSIASNGFNPSVSNPLGPWKNEIRYNYLVGGNVGFKHKGRQYFTGRTSNSPWSDTYLDYGDKIHHNIIINTRAIGIEADMDFAQVFNNIVDASGSASMGIAIEYQVENPPDYKVAVYNNTVKGVDRGIIYFAGYLYTNQLYDIYGYVYNNILDGIIGYPGYLDITQREASGRTFNLANWHVDKNYSYNPGSSYTLILKRISYTPSDFSSQTYTASPRLHYSQPYDNGNLLFQGTSGADNYRIRPGHSVGGTTVDKAGIGGSHPYLNGVTFPSYLGAANPSDDSWVSGVLSLANTTNLRNGGSGDPSWIENSQSFMLRYLAVDDPFPMDGNNEHRTNNATVELTGKLSGFSSIQSISWVNSRGGSGSCQVQNNSTWNSSEITLSEGSNIIQITLISNDADNLASTIEIIYDPNM